MNVLPGRRHAGASVCAPIHPPITTTMTLTKAYKNQEFLMGEEARDRYEAQLCDQSKRAEHDRREKEG